MMTATMRNKPHTHLRVMLKKGNGDLLHEQMEKFQNKTPEVVMKEFKSELTKEFVVLRSQEDYSFDAVDAVEYLKYKALFTTKERLTIHVFTCYCEPLNENQEPPF